MTNPELLWQRILNALDQRGALPAGNPTAQEIGRTGDEKLGTDLIGRFVREYYLPRFFGEAEGPLSDVDAEQHVSSIEKLPIPHEGARASQAQSVKVEQQLLSPEVSLVPQELVSSVTGAATPRRRPLLRMIIVMGVLWWVVSIAGVLLVILLTPSAQPLEDGPFACHLDPNAPIQEKPVAAGSAYLVFHPRNVTAELKLPALNYGSDLKSLPRVSLAPAKIDQDAHSETVSWDEEGWSSSFDLGTHELEVWDPRTKGPRHQSFGTVWSCERSSGTQ